MNAQLLDNPAERRKMVRLTVRPDLQVHDQRYEGKVFHVVKDPVCLRYYRFNKQEYFVFRLFDGRHTMEDVRRRFEDEFKPHRLEFQDLESFARQLVTAGLVQNEAGGAGKHLYDRRRKQRLQRRFAAVSNIMYWKIPLFDPDRLLTWMYGYLWWIFTPTFFALSVGLMLAAVFQVLVHFQTFYDKVPRYQEFFSAYNLAYMWLSIGVVKVIHEFGHGLSCKAYKGECHEMGFLLMCLSPALYCNVTDAWTVADKWKRIIISFAGIYVELFIAAVATFVWWYTPHMPVVNNVAMALMVMCSVSTVFFNANPLMRFDGYYMMADWLEIPNLRDRANKYITNSFLQVAFGIEKPAEQYMAPSRKALFIVYAVASYVYRWVITFSILWFLADFFGPRLKVLSQMLAILSLVSMFLFPVYRSIKSVRQRGRLPDMKSSRVLATLGVATFFAAAVVFIPLPISRVKETGLVALDPSHATPVSLAQPGHLVRLAVVEGESVRRGQLIAEFDSHALREQTHEARAQALSAQADLTALTSFGGYRSGHRDRFDADIAAAQTEVRKHTEEAERLTTQLERMRQLTAPRDGVVMGLVQKSELGKLFDRASMRSRPVCTVGDPTRLVVKLPITPTEHKLIKDDLPEDGGGLAVSIHAAGRTDRVFQGRVFQLPSSSAKQVPPSLTTRGGGTVSVQQAGEGGQETVPVAQIYLLEIAVIDADASIAPGALVEAKIHTRWRSAGWWLRTRFSQAFDLGLYQ